MSYWNKYSKIFIFIVFFVNFAFPMEIPEELKVSIDISAILTNPVIGEGSEKIFYKGRFQDRLVAYSQLKFLDNVEKYRKNCARFFNEVTILSSLDHPNIVKIYGVDLKRKISALELGVCDLKEFITKKVFLLNGSDSCFYLPIISKLKLIKGILEGLSYLYEQRIIHRDFKHSNIIICSEEKSELCVPKLIDFSMAIKIPQNQDSVLTDRFLGTILFASPESFTHKVLNKYVIKPSSDIYALGFVLYFIMSGKNPSCLYSRKFRLDLPRRKIVKNILSGQLEILDNDIIGDHRILNNEIMRCWSRNPEERPTATELLSYINQLIGLFERL